MIQRHVFPKLARIALGILVTLRVGSAATLSSAATKSVADIEWTLAGDGSKTTEPVGLAQKGKRALTARLENLATDDYILTGEVLLAGPGSSLTIEIGESEAKTGKKAARAPSGQLQIDKSGQLVVNRQKMKGEDIQPLGAWTGFRVQALHGKVEIGFAVPDSKAASPESVSMPRRVALTLASGCKARNLRLRQFPNLPELMLPVALDRAANVKIAGAGAEPGIGPAIAEGGLPTGVVEIDGVPFCFLPSADAQGIDVSKDPRQKLDYGLQKCREMRASLSSLQVSGDQYSAIHLIAFSTRRPNTIPTLTARLGCLDKGADIWAEHSVDVPRLDEPGNQGAVSRVPVKLADRSAGWLSHVRVALDSTGNITEFDRLNLEFTRAFRAPEDGFLEQQVDASSGVIVLAATLERAPVTMRAAGRELCNVFHESQKTVFDVQLANRSGAPASGRVYARCSGPGTRAEGNAAWREWTVEQPFTLRPDHAATVSLDMAPSRQGWHSCSVGLEVAGKTLQSRNTSFAILAPDTRKALGDSPFGIWCFWNSHCASSDPLRAEKICRLLLKGGWRWTYGGKPAPEKQTDPSYYRALKERYKFTFNIQSPPRSYRYKRPGANYGGANYEPEHFRTEVLPWLENARASRFDNYYKVLHESRSSKALLQRLSEFLGGAEYQMPPEEQAKLKGQFPDTLEYCRALKQADPQARICLINDYPAFVGEYLKRKFPAELFDVIGLESAMFHRQPERQPDWLCLLGTLHTMKRMQKAYGYDKPVWFTEALYHGAKPGTLGLYEQGAIMTREAMLALANGVQRFAATNVLADCSDDYGKSGWGAAGVCFRDPEYNPKPSFAMYAWMTQILDQTKSAGKLLHDSTALHALDFVRPDGTHVYALWVVRGRQEATLQLAKGDATVYDAYGNRMAAAAKDGRLTVQATDAPLYIVASGDAAIVDHRPIEEKVAQGQAFLNPGDPHCVKVVEGNSALLETTGIPANIKGRFAVSETRVDGEPALRAELLDDPDSRTLIPRYVELQLTKPVAVPGPRPFAIDIRVKGNGGWGRIMLELADAKGRRWTYCGDDEAENLGRTYVNFDGWLTMRLHLPGRYPSGDQSMAWPGGRGWKSDGEEALEYPIQLTKVMVAMRPHILYVDEERAVADRSIYLSRMSVVSAPEGM